LPAALLPKFSTAMRIASIEPSPETDGKVCPRGNFKSLVFGYLRPLFAAGGKHYSGANFAEARGLCAQSGVFAPARNPEPAVSTSSA
jgi:hypothetical protein